MFRNVLGDVLSLPVPTKNSRKNLREIKFFTKKSLSGHTPLPRYTGFCFRILSPFQRTKPRTNLVNHPWKQHFKKERHKVND